ncbi:hypothetical protein [Armatimonas sp.]|uniref:hypothetical protein n=1 Tax=Armatimonas sp. TaxID=1872638 RepID=UPI00375218A8
MTEVSRPELLTLLHSYFDALETDDRQPNALPIRYRVIEETVRLGDYAWHGTLSLSREPRRWAYVHEDIGVALQEIREKTGVNVFLNAEEPAEMESAIAA